MPVEAGLIDGSYSWYVHGFIWEREEGRGWLLWWRGVFLVMHLPYIVSSVTGNDFKLAFWCERVSLCMTVRVCVCISDRAFILGSALLRMSVGVLSLNCICCVYTYVYTYGPQRNCG